MSVSWASEPRRRRAVAVVAGLLLLALAAVAAPAAARHARTDTARAVRSIRIGDDGIRITDSRGDTTVEVRTSTPVDADVDVGGQSVHVRGVVSKTADGHDVRVVGPTVLVDGRGADMVRVMADAEVPAGERVEGDVVAVFGSVTVKGQVSGNAVAVFGSVRVDSGAVVDGDAVAVGGVLDQRPGAVVSGQSVSIEPGFDRRRLPGVVLGHPGLLTVLLLLLLLPAVLGGLLFVFAPTRLLRVAVTATQRPFVSLLLGLASGPLAIIAASLLFLTFVGIPLGLLTPVFLAVIAWAGQVATTYVVGCRLLRRPMGSGSGVGPYLLGALFVLGLVALGLAGLFMPTPVKPIGLFLLLLAVLLHLGLGLIGTGAMLLSRLGANPKDVVHGSTLDSGPAPVPGPAT